MKKAILFSVLLLLPFLYVASQCDTLITLCSQQDVDSFAANFSSCENFQGSLRIVQSDSCDLTNLTPLSFIKKIHGSLTIKSSGLESLNGLSNLKYVGRLNYASPSSDIPGFPVLDTVLHLDHEINTPGEDLSIYSNIKYAALIELDGATTFKGLTSLRDYSHTNIIIYNNEVNEEFVNMFVSPPKRLGGLTLTSNVLVDFKGLESLDSLGLLFISASGTMDVTPILDIDQIHNFIYRESSISFDFMDGFPNITRLDRLQLRNTQSIESIEDLFPSLSEVRYKIDLRNNSKLEDISIFSNFGQLQIGPDPIAFLIPYIPFDDQAIYIRDNPELTTCSNPFICQAVDSLSFPREIVIFENGTYCSYDSLDNANCLSVSTQNKAYTEIEISPNPAYDQVKINNEVTGIYDIIDLQGRSLRRSEINGDKINIGSLSPGNYILRIASDEQILQAIFIKQ